MVTCPRCGNQVTENAAFCSKCGQKLDAQPDKGSRTPIKPPRQERQGCGLSMAVIITAIVVALLLIGIGGVAVYMGLNDRKANQQDLAAEYYDQGVAYYQQSQFELAVAELEMALEADPEHAQAQDLLADARLQLQAPPTDTPAPQADGRDTIFREAETAYDQGNWSGLIDAAARLAALDPDYQRGQVNQMLVAGYIAQGQAAAANGQIGDALAMLDRALAIDPANALALRERELATIYATALASWNSDWPATIESLSTLYTTAPTYADVQDRLYDAHVAYGDSLAQRENWCEAADAYNAAMDVRLATQVVTLHQEATSKCHAASATPGNQDGQASAPTTDETGRPAPSGPSGMYVGRVAEIEHMGGESVFCRGRVYNKAGQGVPSTRVKIQVWDWSAEAMTDADGQYSFDGLGNPYTYTLSLLDLPSQPFDVGLQEGKLFWVDFDEVP